jgi:hypothetical protein
MRNRIFISFLALAGIAFAIYLTINTFYDSLQEDSYGVVVYTPPVTSQQIEPYKPNNRNLGRASGSSQPTINLQEPLTPSLYQPQTSTRQMGRSTPSSTIEDNSNALSQSTWSNQPDNASSTGSGGVLTMPSGRSGRSSSNGGNLASSSAPSYGRTTSLGSTSSTGGNSKYSAPAEYKPFSEGNVGAPDPGGNFDDSCDDDIVFIPVPDGLFFMIFLSFLYAVWKIISFQRKKYLIF